MSGLPKINAPTFKHKLFGLGKQITYRPFTNKEQKILLLAKESKDKNQVIDAVKQVLNLCIVTKGVDVDKMSSFDVEDLFLRIRSKSVEEQVRPIFKYTYIDDEGNEKEERVTLKINLDDVKVQTQEGHTNIIDLDGTYKMKMRYPAYEDINQVSESEDPQKDMVIKCIECVFDDDEVYTMEGESKEEIDEFYDSLSNKTMLQIKDFYDTMPKLYHEIEVKRKDGEVETVRFEGIQAFFP